VRLLWDAAIHRARGGKHGRRREFGVLSSGQRN